MMARTIYRLIISLVTLTSGFTLTRAQGIEALDFLVGKWEVAIDVLKDGKVETTEHWLRECQYTLNKTFITCLSKSPDAKNPEEYRFDFNFDKDNQQYTYSAIWSYFHFRGSYEIVLDSTRSMLHIVRAYKPGKEAYHITRINYSNPDQLTWEGWSSQYDSAPEWVKFFSETTTRVKE